MNDIEFCRWEGDCFGYNYGSGEEHVMLAVKAFLTAAPAEGTYDHKILEQVCTPVLAWLLINIFCKCASDQRLSGGSLIEYGTSPRFGWLTEFGKQVKAYVESKTVEEMCEILGKYEPMEDPIYQEEYRG